MPKFLDVTNPAAAVAALGLDDVVENLVDNYVAGAVAALGLTQLVENIVGNYEPETLSLFDRMTSRPNANNRTAINSLIKELKTRGIWAKLDGLYLMAAHTEQAALLNWKTNARNLIAYNSPSFTANWGFTGDGVSSYLMTDSFSGAGLLMAQDDESMGAWVRTNPGEVPSTITLGENSGGSASIRYINSRASDSDVVVWRMNWSPQGATAGGIARDTSGAANNLFVALSRTGSTAAYQYANGELDHSQTTNSSGTDPRTRTFWFSIGRNGSGYSARQHSAAFYGRGLNANEHAIFYNALYDYMRTVGAI